MAAPNYIRDRGNQNIYRTHNQRQAKLTRQQTQSEFLTFELLEAQTNLVTNKHEAEYKIAILDLFAIQQIIW